ncbi:transglycosylase domain-containing protein [Paenibacillus turpanensis]|uniref:transglycosylase domain-containing protein n=1 Tax=Paenibacillus turpanensis TaxID=2689078 RepID=UPI00140E7EE6|nr:PBP1A family penicillin-binding protein [Paenibacillus turpanensis]
MAEPTKKKKKKKGKPFSIRKLVVVLFTLSALMVFTFIVGYAVIYVNGQKILRENANKFEMEETSIIYDSSGAEFTKLYITQNRQIVSLSEMPKRLQEAFIATEDRRFYEHAGIDFWAIGRAIVKDIIHRSALEGGSTITQQLAKNLFTKSEKTFFRKATEASIAVALEREYTKEQILELYLNRIYFGNGAYGVRAAAERHFGITNLQDLSLAQMATLAGIPKNPGAYSPTNDPEKSKGRRAVVLSLMRQQGIISAEEEQQAKEVTFPVRKGSQERNHFVDYVIEQTTELTGISEEQLYLGGYKIHTTLNAKAQDAAEEAFAKPELFQKDGPSKKMEGGMVILDHKTGGIAAMVGGRDYTAKGLNRAVIRQQPGSTFKPLAVYAPALESGNWNPYSMLTDEKLTYPGGYSPSNWDHTYRGQVTMVDAMKRSMNAPAVWLLNEIGVKRSLDYLAKTGIKVDSQKDRNLAIALGGLTYGISPLDMAKAYGAFANNGVMMQPYAVQRVLDNEDRVIYEFEPSKKQVVSGKTAYYMTELLKGVVEAGGTGTQAQIKGRNVAGKTGSTQLDLKNVKRSDAMRDIWFVGYTPELTAAIWMGFDIPDEKHFIVGSSGAAAKVFSVVMTKALAGTKAGDFTKPEGVQDLKAPPEAVTELKGEYSEDQQAAVLSWTPVKEANVVYRIYRKEKQEAEFKMISTHPSNDVVDLSVAAGAEYEYYVTAVRAENQLEGAKSNTVVIQIPAKKESDLLDTLPLPGIGEDAEKQGEKSREGKPNNGSDSGAGTKTGGDKKGNQPKEDDEKTEGDSAGSNSGSTGGTRSPGTPSGSGDETKPNSGSGTETGTGGSGTSGEGSGSDSTTGSGTTGTGGTSGTSGTGSDTTSGTNSGTPSGRTGSAEGATANSSPDKTGTTSRSTEPSNRGSANMGVLESVVQ